jgi:nucleoside phosphorylase
MKRRFDVAVVVPLDEEFETALSHFQYVADLSTTSRIRFEVSLAGTGLSILFVKQNVMGRTECTNATMDTLDEFDVGLLLCMGIAGGLSADVAIGDICRTGEIVDLLDNAKVSDVAPRRRKSASASKASEKKSNSGQQISFSPTHYATPVDISIALDLDKLLPDRKETYDQWAADCGKFARAEIPSPFTGRDGKKESVGNPVVRSGLIACAAVSDSTEYNKAIRTLDRKILAVETESGGLFSVARRHNVPALTIRGISDYAGQGIDKNVFEKETNNKARLIAVANATSYLARQLRNPRLKQFLLNRRGEGGSPKTPAPINLVDRLGNALISQSNDFNDRLKELAPGFSLQGYRIPVPRVRVSNGKLETFGASPQSPIELRDAVKQARVTVVEIPPQYPDRSMAWIAARDLMTLQVSRKQVVPSVVEARDLHRPKRGIAAVADPQVISLKDEDEALLVFVINEFDFASRSQTEFLLTEVNEFPNAKFVIISRNKSNIISENEFARKTSALIARLDDVSFVETSHFLQKNFEMSGPEAEVVAIRLHETFSKFKLSAHPSYFAGIPAATLTAILRANRRAELIELAVAGYLSFVVAQDDEPLTLSRTTREKFLTLLAFEMKVKKRTFSEDEVIAFASEFAKRFDFNISAVRFVSAFFERSILFLDTDGIRFTLPFMEAYLLAKKLHGEPDEALKYFLFGEGRFDAQTFALYAELGLADELVAKMQTRLDESIAHLAASAEEPPILLTNRIQPVLFSKQDRIGVTQKRLQKAIEDVTNDNDASLEKQRLIDAAERIRNVASQRSQEKVEQHKQEEQRSAEYDAVEIWFVSVLLLGSGAERLEAETKRSLARKVVRLSVLIMNDWTREVAAVDYRKLKSDLLEDVSLLKSLSKSDSDADLAEAKKTVDNLVDLLEYSFVSQPFRAMVQGLCEEARDNVLAESIINANVDGVLENLLHSVWLSDLAPAAGVKQLNATIKSLPSAKLLRMVLASHLMTRVYWRHWNKDHRLKLLSAAQEALKGAGLQYDKAGLQRLIDRETNAQQG